MSKNGVSLTSYAPGYPKACSYCYPILEFHDSSQFARHLRMVHASKEGGSYTCKYGENDLCQKLPLEGVSDVDYEAHIRKFHSGPTKSEDESDRKSSVLSTYDFTSFTQNLSSVLSDPGRTRSEVTTFFTRHWGDGFVPPNHITKSFLLPPVEKSHLDAYQKRIRKLKPKTSRAHRERIPISKDDELRDIPEVFLDKSFLLSHVPTFSEIFLQTSTTLENESKSDGCAQASEFAFRNYDSLNNRLETMHDTVDSQLSQRLVGKSNAFFEIVSRYGYLKQDLQEALEQIIQIRKNLKETSTAIYERSQKILALYNERQKKLRLLGKLKDMTCLREAQSTVQIMLNQSDYPKAIACIEMSEDVLHNDLANVVCFRHLGNQLSELYSMIGRIMQEDFTSLIQREFGTKADDTMPLTYEGELCCVVRGLVQVRRYAFLRVLQNEVNEVLKCSLRHVVKTHVIDAQLDFTLFDPSHLGDAVRRMSFACFYATFLDCMLTFNGFLKRVKYLETCLVAVIGDVPTVTSNAGQSEAEKDTPLQLPPMASSSSDDDALGNAAENMSATQDVCALFSAEVRDVTRLKATAAVITGYAYHCAQQRLARLLLAKVKDSCEEEMNATEVAQLTAAAEEFQRKCTDEGWNTGQMSNSHLSMATQKMSVDFLDRFHASRRAKLSEVLDMELWKSGEVDDVCQRMVDNWTESGVLRVKDAKSTDQHPTKQSIVVNGEHFVVASCALIFIRMLSEYCECVSQMPYFAHELLTRIVELFKFFNSRTCQLILGAGALQLVGLRTISVRNLALASRSLQLVAHFVPSLSRFVEQFMPDTKKLALRHLTQVSRDFDDHVNEIAAKLISVIDHHTINCLHNWTAKPPIPSVAFQQISKQMQKFHNAVIGIFPDAQIEALFKKVYMNFVEAFRLQLLKVGVSPHDSLTFGHANQEMMFLTQKLHEMPGCGSIDVFTLNDVLFSR